MVAIREVIDEAASRRMIGTLALPDGTGRSPAVLIAHEGPGLDQHAKDQATRLAELGYHEPADRRSSAAMPDRLGEVLS